MSGSGTPGWQDGLMSALMSPGVNALAGFAGGMAQAAMPSRMKVPFGAALGFGAQGALQGAGNALSMQQQNQQLRAAQLQNQFAQAAMPTRLSLLSRSTGAGGSGGSAPFGAPMLSSGDGNASSGGGAPSQVSSGTGAQYLQDPRTTLAMAQYALASGDDRASAALLSNLQAEAGGAGYAMGSNGAAFAVPGGGKDPGVIGGDAYSQAAGAGAGGLPATLAEQGYRQNPDGTFSYVPGGKVDPATLYRSAAATGAGGLPSTLAAQQSQAALDRGNAAFRANYESPITFTGPGPDGTKRNFTVPASVWFQPGGLGGIPGGSSASASTPDGTSSPPPGTSSSSSDSSSTPSATSSGAAGATSSPPSGAMTSDTYAQRVASYENPTGNPAAFNGSGPGGAPTSSAIGNGQFTQGTWLPLFKKAFPQQAGQFSDQQIMALRADPQWSSAMTVALAGRNATTLQAAGVPVTAQTLGMSHFLGAGDAVSVWHAPSGTPLSSVLPAQDIAANPTLANQTAGMYRANMQMRFGSSPVDLSSVAGGSQAATGSGTPFPGAIPGASVMSPEQTAVSQAYGDEGKGILDANTKAPDELQKLDVLEAASQGFRPGATGEMRLGAQRGMVDALQGMGITPPQWLTDGAASGETIGKEGMQLAVALTRSLGSREAMGVLQMIRGVMPNVALSEGGFQVILNGIRQGVLRDQDLSGFYQKWVADPSHNGSWAGGEAAFDAQNSPEAYASRVVAMPAPKSAADANPNVIYHTPKGPLLWTGNGFVPAQQSQPVANQ